MIDPAAHPDPPLGMPDPPKDRLEFWVRFTCGALFGLVIGCVWWFRGFWESEIGWLAIPIAGFICAFAAVRWGDNFWVRVFGCFRWWG